MDVVERREKLATKENPDSRMDYVSSLQGRLAAAGAAARITLRYVPDRWIVTPDGFDAYLAGLGDQDWANLESLATAILEGRFKEGDRVAVKTGEQGLELFAKTETV